MKTEALSDQEMTNVYSEWARYLCGVVSLPKYIRSTLEMISPLFSLFQ
jgi:hypothetical protein